MKSGFLLIDKPIGPSSFGIIRQLRRQLQIKKMGHAGTLDPMASGLLVVAVGEATKLLSFLDTGAKEYIFEIQFGETRNTGDSEGEVLEDGFSFPSEEEIVAVLPQFRGEIEQTPPIYSAIKINGKKAYQLAREGKEVKMKSRKVTLSSLELLSYDTQKGLAKLKVYCTSGTYVRSLSQDIATACKSGAYAASIHRTEIGPFKLSDSSKPDDVLEQEQIISPLTLLPQWKPVVIAGRDLELMRNGNRVPCSDSSLAEGDMAFTVTEEQDIVAFVRLEEGFLKTLKVFVS